MPTGIYKRKKKSIRERFESKFIVGSYNDCWEWKARISPFGYGQFSIASANTQQAHRFSWVLYRGAIPKRLCVLHKCDNRKCVNPKHLWIGTQQENIQDMIKKSRDRKAPPERNGGHKITWQIVNKIRELYPKVRSMRKLEKQFNISRRQIGRIIHNISWKMN